MSLARKVARRQAHAFRKLRSGGKRQKGPDGKDTHVLFSSQVEALAVLRAMPIPPAPPGEGDSGIRDEVDPVAYRREMNAKKRARRARRSK